MSCNAGWGQIRQWVTANRLTAALSLLLLVFDIVAGAALGAVVAWGPLDLGRTFWVAVFGALFAVTAGGLRLQQIFYIVIGNEDRGLRWKKGLDRGRNAIIGAMVSLVLIQLYSTGFIMPFSRDYEANFKHLWTVVDKHYPYFAVKGVDWQKAYERYAPKVARVQNDAEYRAIVHQMLMELNDAHTGVVRPGPNANVEWLGLVEEVEGKAAVTAIRSRVNIPGLEVGSVILSRAGKTVLDYVNSPNPAVYGSSPRQRRYRVFSRILAVPRGEEVDIIYLTPDGKKRTATLSWREQYRSLGNEKEHRPLITSRTVPSGVAVIKIPTFASQHHDLVAEFDAALDAVFDAPGLILDLRGNGGGSTFVSEPIAGRFFTSRVIYGVEYRRHRLPFSGWARVMRYEVRPRRKVYQRPLAVITSVENMSTAELFIAALKDSGRAVTVGRTTAGASGNPISFQLPGGTARFSVGDWHRINGKRIEGVGIQPDIPVNRKIEDIRRGVDRDLAAAEAYLCSQF